MPITLKIVYYRPGSSLLLPTESMMYSHLNERQIRLLIVMPTIKSFEDTIICELETISLDSSREYRALSYVWGDPSNTREIIVNEHPVSVTVNLELALRRLRAHAAGQTMSIWVDAVCINQGDISEREDQVAMMGDIYSRCSTVCIWLGAFGTDNDPVCLDHHGLENWGETENGASTGLVLCARAMVALAAPGSHIRDIVPDAGPSTQTMIDTITGLAQCPWFDRAWIVQESYLAPYAQVYFGNITMSSTALYQSFTKWHFLRTDCPCCHEINVPEEYRPILTPMSNFLLKLRTLVLKDPAVVGTTQPRSAWTKSSVGLLEYTLEHRKHKCADPRDHIYAFQGIVASWLDVKMPRPIYAGDRHATAADLYLRVCTDAILNGGTLTFLGWNNSKSEYRDLPSWAMDWSSSGLGNELAWIQASKKWNSARDIPLKADIFGRTTLVAQGLQFDNIAGVGRLCEDGLQLIKDEELWVDWHRTTKPARESNDNTYPSGESWRDAWWKALCFDSADSECKRTEREIRAFELVATVLPVPFNFSDGVSPECEAMGFERTMDSIMNMFMHTTQKIWGQLPLMLTGHQLFVTELGYFGWARDGIHVGDPVFLLGGCTVPLILRETGRVFSGTGECNAGWPLLKDCPIRELISGAYIYGIMDGEIVDKMGPVVPGPVCIE